MNEETERKAINKVKSRMSEIQQNSAGRFIYIWGTGAGGATAINELEKAGIGITGIISSDAIEKSCEFRGYTVTDFVGIEPDDSYIVVATMNYYEDIIHKIKSEGFTNNDVCCLYEMLSVNTEDIVYKGCKIGKYTYGYENLLEWYPIAEKIGRFCSISDTARVWNNHSVDCITTSPVLDHVALNHWMNYDNIKESVKKYGRHHGNSKNLTYGDESELRNNPPVYIGNDVWIGADVIILPGVRIGDGAILAAGAVITKDVAPYSIVGGVPAKVIKYRFTQEQTKILGQIKWWDWTEKEFEDRIEMLYDPEWLFRWYKENYL